MSERLSQYYSESEEEENLEKDASPEAVFKTAENSGKDLIDRLRQEGEVSLFRLQQIVDLFRGHDPSRTLEEHRHKSNKNSSPDSINRSEIILGTLSLGVRKAIEGATDLTKKFSEKLAELSEKTSKKFSDAENLYGIK